MKTAPVFCQILQLADNTLLWQIIEAPNPIRDALGAEIPLPSADYYFFIDHFPEANWAHSCGYLAVTATGLHYCPAEWPPGPDCIRRFMGGYTVLREACT